MNDASLTSALEALLRQHGFQDSFSPAGFAELMAALCHIEIGTAEVLLRQGDAGDDVYLILEGLMGVRAEHADGSSTLVDEIGPGGVVGEMALLTGLPRTATVVALTTSHLARLSRTSFEQLAARYPDALHQFLRRILPRMRRTQLVRLLIELFGNLEEKVLREIEAKLDWVHLRSGAMLFREGDASDDVYLVVNGRLRVVSTDDDGRERALEEVGRGGAVGEVALLTGETRAASIYAIRDTHLLRLAKPAFDELLDRYPRVMMQVARAAVWRLRRSSVHRYAQRSGTPITFALIPAGPDVPLADFARRLADTLHGFGSTLCLGSGEVDRLLARPGIAQTGDDTVVHESISAWLGNQEREHVSLVLKGDAEWTAWTRRCVLQADRVLIVARAGANPAPGACERAFRDLGLKVRAELVLLQPDATLRPTGTLPWLAARDVAAHHHVRLGNDSDVRRVARRISGRAVGLVLGGGGARGFAHIGMLRALAEARIEVDVVGGTSIGALIAAGAAADVSVAEMERLAASFASPKQLLDRTLPVVALMAGGKVTRLFRQVFGEVAVEDLWIPYFGVSSGLSRATAVVHQRGPLWKVVRASTALPAIFPPLLGDDGEVLVDGGVMNNMPLDVMRDLCEGGTVIGVNPMPTHDRLKDYHFGSSVSGWQALMGRLRLFGSRIRAPSILGSVMRATEINSANRMRQPAFRALADLLIEPPVGGFPILAFDQYAPIIDIGYRTAKEQIAAWQAATGKTRAP